jgi:hypothetical protein
MTEAERKLLVELGGDPDSTGDKFAVGDVVRHREHANDPPRAIVQIEGHALKICDDAWLSSAFAVKVA